VAWYSPHSQSFDFAVGGNTCGKICSGMNLTSPPPCHLKGRDHVGYLHVDRRMLSKWIFEKQGVSLGTGLNWFRIGSSGKSLWTW